MSGAGHMLHAIKSLKANRDLLKNKRSKNRGNLSGDDKMQVEFKRVKPEELARIKASIREDAKKSQRKEVLWGLIIFATLILLLVWFLN